jgi:1-acyl-sn-glycerol-3-phosphate acyltransferase
VSDAPRRKRPPEASAPLTKAKVLVAFARTQVPSASHLLRGIEFPLRPPTVPGSIEPLPPEKRMGADYDTEWARRPTARAARRALFEGLIRPTISAVADPEVRGLDRVGHIEGPVIFAANHHSHLDTAVLLSALPGRFRNKVFIAAAADYFFTNRLAGGASALALNAIPIERTKVTRRSADLAADLIADGWSMAIFPEGGRSPDGWGQAFRGGAAYLALRCDVPVIPVHLWGTDRLLPKGAKQLKRGSTVVTFGAALRPADSDDSRRFAARLEREVAALADEATSDWWSARRRAHADETPSLSGPDASAWRRTWALGERDPHQRDRRQGAAKIWP